MRPLVLLPCLLPSLVFAEPGDDAATYARLVGTWRCSAEAGERTLTFGANHEYATQSDAPQAQRFSGTVRLEAGVLHSSAQASGAPFGLQQMAERVSFEDPDGERIRLRSAFGEATCSRISETPLPEFQG